MATTLGTLMKGEEVQADRTDQRTCVYWHRQLPPVEAEMVGEHVLEATSRRVPGLLAYRDALWDSCYQDLMANADVRVRQEIDRLGGHYAHVLHESVDSRHDDAAGEAWLRGRFRYMLYRRPREHSGESTPRG